MANVDLGRYRKIVQMFWDPEPSNDPLLDQPVWCLGQTYKLHRGHQEWSGNGEQPSSSAGEYAATAASTVPEQSKTINMPPNNAPDTPPASTGGSFSYSGQSEMDRENGWPQNFVADFESRFWMTYRSEFKPIPRSTDPKAASSMSLPMRIKYQLGDQGGFSSDSGWGCMIRSGQSLLANAIGMVRLGRDWRRGQRKAEEIEILRMFADDPAAPYAIHNFVNHGSSRCGKYPGEWFGPSATSQCIKALANTHETNMRVYTTGDSPDVYEDSFMATAKSGDGVFKPTVILISTRLGIDKITPVYWEALISALQMPQSLGIAGYDTHTVD
ncbi:Peptidase C54 [Akanthomyces lecanii RCEF 1005]|uniref:Cysteine protease n=1 Tax=Akanthomyces lecanii RCEF 1005 TaxID=1081108 RepID=A0A162KNV3_CORDF|nr:Peptidase C54 [Akanthomyces lecanii RCEF 1005]